MLTQNQEILQSGNIIKNTQEEANEHMHKVQMFMNIRPNVDQIDFNSKKAKSRPYIYFTAQHCIKFALLHAYFCYFSCSKSGDRAYWPKKFFNKRRQSFKRQINGVYCRQPFWPSKVRFRAGGTRGVHWPPLLFFVAIKLSPSNDLILLSSL